MTQKHEWLQLFVSLSAVALIGASGCGDDFHATLDEPWEPWDGKWDPTCDAGCEEVVLVNSPHLGEYRFLRSEQLQDPLAQWGNCFASFYLCWDATDDLSGCVADAACPQPCRDEYARIAGGAPAFAAEVQAFEDVFLDEAAACRPPERDLGLEVSP